MATAYAVIGANFGDEGKGLCVDRLSTKGSLVIRHNGGAQAGHTVETDGKRFVFHQLSSGSFRSADTFWAETFLPDLFKLTGEVEDFYRTAGYLPALFSHPDARVTVIDDVIINMALETSRGEARHGSCGMGINEAFLRSGAGFGLTVYDVKSVSAEALYTRLRALRDEYCHIRLDALGLRLKDMGEYGELLSDSGVLYNAAEGMKRGAELVELKDAGKLFTEYESVVFEGAQGLLLDSENKRFAPNVTASRTGLNNPVTLSKKYGLELKKVFYVMRSYVTRHGAGELPEEREPVSVGSIVKDGTNVKNEWQGSLRYGLYESPEALATSLLSDMEGYNGEAALFITHLNETGGYVRFAAGDIPAEKLISHPAFFGRLSETCLSATRYAADVKVR